MRLAYVLDGFPHPSETFILRELDEIAARPGVDARLYYLFPAPPGARHEAALRWLPRVRRSSPMRALRGLAWCFGRHPLRTTRALGSVVADYIKHPKLLGRALVAFAAAAAHVPEISGSALLTCTLNCRVSEPPSLSRKVSVTRNGSSRSSA